MTVACRAGRTRLARECCWQRMDRDGCADWQAAVLHSSRRERFRAGMIDVSLGAKRRGAIDELARTRRCAAFPNFLGTASACEMDDRHVSHLGSSEPAHRHHLSVDGAHCGIGSPGSDDQEFDHPDARTRRPIRRAPRPRNHRYDAAVRREISILELWREWESRLTPRMRDLLCRRQPASPLFLQTGHRSTDAGLIGSCAADGIRLRPRARRDRRERGAHGFENRLSD